MTGIELQSTLMALGCPASVAEEDTYLYLVNASLNKIYNDVCITAKGSIYAHGILPKTYIKERYHAPGADISIPIIGQAYSLRICGERADLLVGAGTTTSKLILTENPTVLKGFTVNGMAIITLLGDYSYSAFDVCTYDNLLSLNKEDIPDGGEYTIYNVSKRYSDFSSFASYPVDMDGKLIEVCEASGNTLKVKANYRGEIFFTYRRRATECLELDAASEIVLPSQYEMLLPMLFMAYYYLDTDEDKAESYMQTYKDMLKTLQKQESYKYIPPEEEPVIEQPPMEAEYTVINGWA